MRYKFRCFWLTMAYAAIGCGGSKSDQPSTSDSGGSAGHVESALGGASGGGAQSPVGGSKSFGFAGATTISSHVGSTTGVPSTGDATFGGGSPSTGGNPVSGGGESRGSARNTGVAATAAGAAGATASGGTAGTVADRSATGGVLSAAGATNAREGTSTGCADRATLTAALSGDKFWETTEVPTTGDMKSYLAFPNWWREYSGQVINLAGLGFTISGVTPDLTNASLPAGSPSLFIGGYSGAESLGSNLPKRVSSITTIPTAMETNALLMETNHVATAYQFVFTGSEAPLRLQDPRRATYLEIWLYKPTGRQPVGMLTYPARSVDGISGSWDVWLAQSDPYVTYVSASPLGEVEFDASNFIRDAVKNGHFVKSTLYLNAVLGGFHVWAGGDGMQVKRFCVQVN